MDLRDITDNKKFGANIKPLFSNKIKPTECITLKENGKIISKDKEVVRMFKKYFLKIVPNLGINTNHDFLINTEYLKVPQMHFFPW